MWVSPDCRVCWENAMSRAWGTCAASALIAFGSICLSACTSDDSDDGRGGGSGGGDGDGTGLGGGDGDSFNAGNGNGTGSNGFDEPMYEGGDAEVSATFIWIANSGEGTVSKIDTRSMEELGRYWTSPQKNGHPSRTSVGGTGAVVVANRGGGGDFGANPTGVVKIHANHDDCEDRNGNGMVDTSTGAADIKEWMEDECMAWWTPLDFFSNRPISWAPPAGPDLPETVWTAGTTSCLSGGCSFSVLRLNGDTGAIEERVEFGPLTGVSFVSSIVGGGIPIPGLMLPDMGDTIIGNYGPYGGAADAGGNFWGFNSNTMHLFRVDALTLEARTWEIPMANGYGITIAKGHIFLCGDLGITRFDPATQTFTENFGAIDTGFNGCMTDGGDKIWVGGGADFGINGLHAFDANSLQFIQSYDVGGQVKGVSIDFDGKVWGVGGGSSSPDNDKAFRLDPMTGTVDIFRGLVQAYSYSDMTGFGLQNSGPVIVPVE